MSALLTWRVTGVVRRLGPDAPEDAVLGDLEVVSGVDARVGDLVVALGTIDPTMIPADIGWAGIELDGAGVVEADTLLGELPVIDGDRLVVLVSPAVDGAGRPGAAFAPVAAGPPAPVVEVRSTDGSSVPPTALAPGVHAIGRGVDGNAVVVDDPSVSRRHARLNIGRVVTIDDLGSMNGTLVDGRPAAAGQRVEFGSIVTVGDTSLEVRPVAGRVGSPCVDALPTGLGGAVHRRTGRHVVVGGPAVVPPVERRVLVAPTVPAPVEVGSPPWLTMAIPVALAAALVLVPVMVGGTSGSFLWLSAAFLLMSPIMMGATYWESRRSARRAERSRREAFDTALDRLRAEGVAVLAEELSRRRDRDPGPAEWRERLVSGERVWCDVGPIRRLRVGETARPSAVEIESADGGAVRPGNAALDAVVGAVTTHERAPLAIEIDDVESSVVDVAVVGERSWCATVVTSMVLQSVTRRPPGALSVVVVTDDAGAWNWLRWLPHECRVVAGVDELDALPSETAAAPTVVVVDRSEARLEPSVAALAGAIVLRSVRDRRVAPASTTWLVEQSGDAAEVAEVSSGITLVGVDVDRVGPTDADRWARDLARLEPPDAGRADGLVAIPEFVSTTDVLGVPHEDGWSATERPLAAPIGRSAAGVLEIDLRSDGPHAVVAGTTGSGKSELLQTWVASLAVRSPPSRLNFLLVDYKGGAAFGACAALPHVVGLVTDLDAGLVDRVLLSLRAEVRRRERVLAAAAAKDLVSMEAAGHPDTPPSLVIVVDEFASIAAEVEGFLDGMIDIARRGRSLGLHLVLATQRPAGVISEHLLANANLRIALRLADEHESRELVGVPDAAHLARSTPGRAVVRRGAGDVVHVQAAFSGRRPGAGAGGDSPAVGRSEVRVRRLRVASTSPSPSRSGVVPAVGGGVTELDRIVGWAVTAAAASGVGEPRRPWLPPLPNHLSIADLIDEDVPWAGGTAVVWGLLDHPDDQAQYPARHDLAAGPTIVHGVGSTRRVVETLVVGAVVGSHPDEVRVDVVDGDAAAFARLATFPQVGSVLPPDDTERVARLLRELRSSVGRGPALPVRILVVDDVVAFAARHDSVDGAATLDDLAAIVADGAASGIHVVMTAASRLGIPHRVATGARRILLRSTPDDDVRALGAEPRLLAGSALRAVVDGRSVQAAVLDDDGPWSLAALAETERRRLGASRAPTVGRLPDVVRAEDLARRDAASASSWSDVLIGVRDADLAPAWIDLTDGNVLIAGPMRSGRSTALGAVAASVASVPPVASSAPRPTLVLVAPRRTPIADARWWDHIGVGRSALEIVRRARCDAVADGTRLVVFVDDATDVDAEVDDELVALVGASREHDVRIVATAESALARRAYGGLVAELRRERRALLLHPDADLDGDLAGVRLPRRRARAWPPGRAELVVRGHIDLVQVALAAPTGSVASRRSLFRLDEDVA